MDILEIDIETYSTVDLPKANVYAYVEDPAFEVLMCGWSLNGSPVEVVEGEDKIDSLVPGLWDPEVKKVAHNAGFERICFSRMANLPVGEYLPPEDWYDTMAVAAEYGLPRGLDALARALKVQPKDTAGTRLKHLFTQPNAPKKGAPRRRIFPHERPDDWAAFMAYCRGDVETMALVRRKMAEWGMGGWPSEFERDLWYADQRVNDRGILVNLPLARAARDVAEANDARLAERVTSLTGIENPNSGPQIKAWCAEAGYPLDNLQAETVTRALENADCPDDVREVLELRQELALVASKKYSAMLRGVSLDGRLRGQFSFHAAHTGRWSSRGVQVHNLVRKVFTKTVEVDGKDEEVTDWALIEAITLDLLLGLGADPVTLKKMVRPTFVSPAYSDPDGDPFAISDFSAIEARVLAWLSGEEWVLQAFREGRDLYVETAERMGGGMGRPEGKIAVLAAGYQGSVGSFRNMGYGGRLCPFDATRKTRAKDPRSGDEYADMLADLGVPEDVWDSDAGRAYLAKAERLRVPEAEVLAAVHGHVSERERDPNHKCDSEILAIVRAWREANEITKEFWYDIERKFWTGGVVGAGKIRIERRDSARLIHLPSGRVLYYHGVHKTKRTTVNEETGEKRTKVVLAYRHIQGYIETTYGGRLTENVTQAVARDLLADALLRLDQAGYFVVAHIHDEAVAETRDIEGMTAIMREAPAWAEGLPMDASGDIVLRYTK